MVPGDGHGGGSLGADGIAPELMHKLDHELESCELGAHEAAGRRVLESLVGAWAPDLYPSLP